MDVRRSCRPLRAHPHVLTVGPLALLALSACDGIALLEDEPGLVHVLAAHHGAPKPELKVFPDYGEEDKPRVFTTDLGWSVRLTDAYLVITRVALVDCEGGLKLLPMFWGHFPEDMSDADLHPLTVAGDKVPSGEYCELHVTYGPYRESTIKGIGTAPPASADVEGRSILLTGLAAKNPGDQALPFVLRSAAEVTVELPLADLRGPGKPFNVEAGTSMPLELTVSKTYDQFFRGVDFSTMNVPQLEARLPEILAAETRISAGTDVAMYTP